jgi:hypothetical protein
MDMQHNDWRNEFQTEDLAAIRDRVPQAIQRSQDRAARAHAEYADPDGDQDVYGVGMARGVQKELRSLLSNLASYREMQVPKTRRVLTFVGDALIFSQRVGKQMPRNYRRIRQSYLPDSRRELLEKTSNVKYSDPGLFDIEDMLGGDHPASLEDVLAHVGSAIPRTTLFVPYYSSTPHGVGTIFFAPARLNGRYLEFTDPERLVYQQKPVTVEQPRGGPRPVNGFADGERPRTGVRLRKRTPEKEGV